MSVPTELSIRLYHALRMAEDMAARNQDTHSVIYQRAASVGAGAGPAQLVVKLARDPAPEGAHVLTTVSRKAPRRSNVSAWHLRDAVEHMAKNMPVGTKLAPRALIEHYPRRSAHEEFKVFAYQFFSTEGLNVGFWIPDVHMNGVSFLTGFEGRGRIYQGAFENGQIKGPGESIGWMIDAAFVDDLDPGECGERYLSGWRRAEDYLRRGGHPDDDGPPEAEEEVWTGYIDRMNEERKARADRGASALGPAAKPVTRKMKV